MSKLKVFSMFDGVGGFPLGLKQADNDYFDIMYTNQYEPARKAQIAFEIGRTHFPEVHAINKDISLVSDDTFKLMKDTGVNMIVGGFPCQDYSVAHKGAKGLEGKKGVLFWKIVRAVENINPKYLILENVDRLLKSPAKQRGRDFAVMLRMFDDLGYFVEWRVINAAEYGFSQRRKRVFLFVYRKDTVFGKKVYESFLENDSFYSDYLYYSGLFAKAFPVKHLVVKGRVAKSKLATDVVDVSDNFSGTFYNSGIMVDGMFYTIETEPDYNGPKKVLKDVLLNDVDSKYYVDSDKLEQFKYLRGAKNEKRVRKDGSSYYYKEGAISPYDKTNIPSRTMLTSEGSLNRSTHLLKVKDNVFRTLTPIEAERLQGFPDDWTKEYFDKDKKLIEVSDTSRMFFMGNALVVGVVERIAKQLKVIDMDL